MAADELLTTTQLADELGLHATTLAEWRLTDDRGPAFCKLGAAVRYRRADVDAWIAANLRTGTRQAGG